MSTDDDKADMAAAAAAAMGFAAGMRRALATALYSPVKRASKSKSVPATQPTKPRVDAAAISLALFATDWLTMEPQRTARGVPSARSIDYAAKAGVTQAELMRQFRYLARTPPGRAAAQRAVQILQAKRQALTPTLC